MICFLTLEQILRLHDAAVDKFGGLTGIRDQNLLLSCIESPKQCLFGEDLCPTVYDKAAAYFFNIVRNHPFNDSNKRTGLGSAYLFLRINKVPIAFESRFEDETIDDFVVKVAQSKKATKEEVAYFLEFGKEIKSIECDPKVGS